MSLDMLNIGRITIELFPEKAPKASENFRLLCVGGLPPVTLSTGRTFIPGLQGTIFFRVIQGVLIQGGDITVGDGTGGYCVLEFESVFEDESLGWAQTDTEGLVCMANCGPDTNTSQFFITLGDSSFLAEKHTVFGKVVEGIEVVREIGAARVDRNDKPKVDVVISNCGEVESKEPKHAARLTEDWEDGYWEDGYWEDGDWDGKGANGGEKQGKYAQPRYGGPSAGWSGTAASSIGGGSGSSGGAQEETDAPRGRSRAPVSPTKTKSPEHRRHHHRRHHHHHRSRSPRHRRRSHTPRRYRERKRSYTRDDPDAETRILREERERESQRRWDPIPDAEVKFKGRGTMRYRERKQWGGVGGNSRENYGRLN